MTFLLLVIGLIFSVILSIYLLWRRSWRSRLLGLICLSFLILYFTSWWSDWYIVRGSERVQAFSTNSMLFGGSPAIEWIDNPLRLLLVPVDLLPGIEVEPNRPQMTKLVVADLEIRQASWQPPAAVNLNEAQSVFDLPAHIEEHNNVATLAALPSGNGLQAELSCFCFSVSLPTYNLAIPFGDYGWATRTSYFGVTRLIVREFKSGSVVVELNQTLFNAPFLPRLNDLARWLPGGKFLIFSGESYGDNRILAIGPFSTSPNTHKNIKSKE